MIEYHPRLKQIVSEKINQYFCYSLWDPQQTLKSFSAKGDLILHQH